MHASVPVVLIIVGIVLLFVSEILGGVLILAGLVLLFVSYSGRGRTRV